MTYENPLADRICSKCGEKKLRFPSLALDGSLLDGSRHVCGNCGNVTMMKFTEGKGLSGNARIALTLSDSVRPDAKVEERKP